ncbi:hypothetical protein KZ483_01950 [Paenibacillus sp. sptzw28]|uniref:hypothetical protein n=1 Tax=Paenibacillus sp. sptzw28 TaxID=715179 RepID=UPI001C6F1432|nr:hypothetical protein [Paenibacillus sp. sptzw28]QYR21831.1 hypothetical protein KZ483_01950 [Paenibacillus sp. sptzw28]
MTETLQTVLDRIHKVSQKLSGIPAGERGREQVLQSFRQELSDMGRRIQSVQQQQAGTPEADKTRKMLAGCRADLFRIIKEIDVLMTDFAEAYRQSIGDRKNQFEQLSEIMQQSSDPQAYQHKHVFGQLTHCKDQIRLLTSSIMDVEGGLEHRQLLQKGFNSGAGPDVADLGEPSDRPSLSP